MTRHNLPCPDCGSKKSLSEYHDGTYCHKCHTTTNKKKNVQEKETDGETVEVETPARLS